MAFGRGLHLLLVLLCLAGQAVAEQAKMRASSEVLGSKPPDPPAIVKKVAVTSVAIFTLLMALCSGLGAIPFFFLDLKNPAYAGICNGIASGVMLAASFGLIQEGKGHSNSSCVVVGLCLGGLFIYVSEKVLSQYKDLKHADLRSAGARKLVLFIIIMTLHAFGEGAGVGVSFAGPRGLPQGILVTVAIAIHNIPEGMAVSMVMNSKGMTPRNALLWSIVTSLPQPLVAVPAFVFAETFDSFLPLCMGFAAGCMIWLVFSELMPESIAETSPTAVAASATLSIAFMELMAVLMDSLEAPGRPNGGEGNLFWALLFGLGPFFGGLLIVAFRPKLSQAYGVGLTAGVLLLSALARPLQLVLGGRFGILQCSGWLLLGALCSAFAARVLARKGKEHEKEEVLKGGPDQLLASPLSKATALATSALALQTFSEGFLLGSATSQAPRAIGPNMLIPVLLHSLPRGAAVATVVQAASGSKKGALLWATVLGFASPLGASASLLRGSWGDFVTGSTGKVVLPLNLERWFLIACGTMLPAARYLLPRVSKVDPRRTCLGCLTGAVLVAASLAATRLTCLNTAFCNFAPDVVT